MRTRATVQFVGLSGYEYPHTRVRCYQFADALRHHGYRTRVLSFRDRMAPSLSEAAMYGLSDARRLRLVLQGALRLALRPHALLYVQKLHYHALAALTVHRMLGAPFVLDYDDWEVGTDPYGVPLFCGFKDPRLTRNLFGSCDPERILERVARRARLVVCASHFLQDRLSEFTRRVAYVPTGVDTARFLPQPEHHDGVVILWNGVVWGEMIRDNVLMLLRSFPAVRQACPEARVRIIGRGAFMEEVRQATVDLEISPYVEFPGWIQPDAMPAELARADIGVMPVAHDDAWTTAKSPTKLFEYMAAGLGVVVMGRGEAAHVVKHQASGLVVDDERGFAAHLLALATNAVLRRSLGAAARIRVEECFSLAVLGAELAQHLRRYWRGGGGRLVEAA